MSNAIETMTKDIRDVRSHALAKMVAIVRGA